LQLILKTRIVYVACAGANITLFERTKSSRAITMLYTSPFTWRILVLHATKPLFMGAWIIC